MKIFQKSKFNLDRILELGIYLLLFLFPLQSRYFLKESYIGSSFWEYGSVSIYLIDILLLLLFFLAVFLLSQKKENKNIKKIWIILGAFEFFVFLSIFFAPSKVLAIYGYLKFLLGLSLFFVLTEAKYNFKKAILFFLSGIFVQSIIGVIQFIFNFSRANKFLGMSEKDPLSLGISVVELSNGERILRAYGGLDHPNIYGAFLLLGIVVFLKYLFDKNSKSGTGAWSRFFPFAVLIFFIFAFLFSFSRSSLLAYLFVVVFFVFFFLNKKIERSLFKKLFLILFFAPLLVFIFNKNLFLERVDLGSRLEIISVNERASQMQEAKNIIRNNFFFGVGINNYTNYLYLNDELKREAWEYQPVHNVYLLVLAEIGVFGFLAFFYLFFYLINKFIITRSNFSLLFLFLILFLSFFDHWMWSLHFGILFFFLALSFAYKSNDV